ncbi:MAG TPA: hypothetical protein ENJ95_17045 [Bacteroidetes bacterium]|nr:hypothetical protein [Bacteroidota bacterium]
METNIKIYCAQTDAGQFYFNKQPVWTCPNADILSKVERAAKTFGAACQNVSIKKTVLSAAVPKKGRVVVLDKKLAAHGRLYAHLTQRHFEICDPAAIAKITDLEIVVCLNQELDVHLMDGLYEKDFEHGFAPGIICAPDIEKLWEKVLLKSIAFHFPVQRKNDWLHYYPTLDHELQIDKQTNTISFGGNMEGDFLKKKMTGHSDFLLIAKSHSDGMDAIFSPFVMCSLERNLKLLENKKTGNLPGCLANDYCHRLQQPLAEALDSGKLFSPSRINTKLLLFNTCTGILIGSPTIDPKWGYAQELLDNPDIHTLVTSWKIITSDLEKLPSLPLGLQSGKTLGKALAEYNKTTAPVRYGLAIFGEPNLRYVERAMTETTKPAPKKQSAKPLAAAISELTFLDYYFDTLLLQMSGNQPGFEKMIQIKKTIASLKLGFLSGLRDEAEIDYLQKSVLDFLYATSAPTAPLPMNVWSSFHETKWQPGGSPCFHCQSPVKVYSALPRLPFFPERNAVHCPLCGVSSDLPVSFPRFEIKALGGQQVKISGLKTLAENEQLSLQMHYPDPSNNQCFIVPKEYDFSEDLIYLPDDFFRNSPLFLSLILMRGFQFGMVKIPVRGEEL